MTRRENRILDFKDYYEVLGVSKSASDKEIKSAYRKLAKKYHPDANPGDKKSEERFKEINEAYEVLSDPEKKKQYEELGSNWQQYSQGGGAEWFRRAGRGEGAGGRRSASFTFDDLNSSGFSEFFQMFFGGMGDGQGPQVHRAGRSMANAVRAQEHELEITLLEAFQGGERQLDISVPDGGTKRIIVKIPKGSRTGTKVKVAGAGSADIILKLYVKEHPGYELKGDDLYTKIDVPLYDAVLGGSAPLTLLDGRRVNLTIPQGTANGRLFRFKGQGMPVIKTDRKGDLYVELKVVIPEDLSEGELELFRRLKNMREKSTYSTTAF